MEGSYKVAGHVAWRQVGEEVIVLDLNSSDYYSLNDTGAAMWALFAKGLPFEKVVAKIAAEYDATAEAIKKDADRFLKLLRKAKFLEPA